MINLRKDHFEQEILNTKGYIVVDFWADNCGMCDALSPKYEELYMESKKDLKFAKFKINESIKIAISQKVLGVPTVILYKDGKKVDQLVKDKATKENIKDMLEKYL